MLEIFKEFDQINSSILKGLIDNKQLFLKEFSRIKNILKIHQDYKAILDNIFHNFNYFIQNFDLIEEWLLSDDFKERYKKENHPYPSLLDPKKLNDKNEKINYKNIPAELAWEMNLPLPDKYKFVYWCSHGTGGAAFANFLRFLNGGGIGTPIDDSNIIQIFKNIYDFSFVTNFDFKYIALRNYHHHEKFYFLLPKIPGVHITRDPISILKSCLNLLRPYHKAVRYFDINANFKYICSKLVTMGDWNFTVDLNSIEYFLNHRLTLFHDSQLKKALVNTQKHFIINMDDIVGSKTFITIEKMCNFLSISIPNMIDKTKFEKKAINDNVGLLPLTLNIYKNIDLFVIDESWISIVDSGVILWNNWLTYWGKAPEGYCINVTHCFFSEYEKKILKGIAFYIKKDFYDIFVNELKFKKEIKSRIIALVDSINQQKQILENKKIKETNIINFMKGDKKIRLKCKKVFDEHLLFIKQHRSDIVASWKYYQEFEKMCEELDGDCAGKTTE
ncbi:sugar transferase [Campylobacter jejuni]|nr:DUF2972 domain-containing protein [Campylobacter jejuni]RTH85401.1 sugar transferase [Campylobacter jejuni]